MEVKGIINRATTITRPTVGQEDWVELYVGDIINCRVYSTDRHGRYIRVDNAVVKWEDQYGQYSLVGDVDYDGHKGRQIYPLRDIVRDDIEFVKKVGRGHGNQRETVLVVVDMLKSFYQKPWEKDEIKAEIEDYDGDDKEQVIINTVTEKMMVALVSEIADFDIISREEINEAFNKER